jgi:hypothetical protein
MDAVDLAWLAGLLEGEGSFMLSKSRTGGKIYHYARVGVQMADRDVVERAAALMGAKSVRVIRPIPKRGLLTQKVMFRAWKDGAGAAGLIRELRPFMGERRKAQMDAVLADHGSVEVGRPPSDATKRWNVKLTPEQVSRARTDRANGATITSIAKAAGVSRTAIREAILGHTHAP